MADLRLGPVSDDVLVDSDVCAKSGRTTTERVTLRGTTTPGWVMVLLLISIVGFLLASAMTSRRFCVTLPWVHELHRRWVRNRRVAWAVAIAGAVVLVGGAHLGGGAGWSLLPGLAVMVLGAGGGVVNAVRNGVGFRTTRDGDLVVSGVHPDLVRAVAAARVDTVPRQNA